MEKLNRVGLTTPIGAAGFSAPAAKRKGEDFATRVSYEEPLEVTPWDKRQRR
jgi:hypothetical protein